MKYKQQARRWFARYIKARDMRGGVGRCISCGRVLREGSRHAQAGHYYPAGVYRALEFDEDNVHLQCLQCNYYRSGNLQAYREGLLRKIGEERLKALDERARLTKRNIFKAGEIYYKEMAKRYRMKYKEIC